MSGVTTAVTLTILSVGLCHEVFATLVPTDGSLSGNFLKDARGLVGGTADRVEGRLAWGRLAWWRDGYTGRSSSGVLVGWREPPAGSTVKPSLSPAASPDASTGAPLPGTRPADRVTGGPISHS